MLGAMIRAFGEPSEVLELVDAQEPAGRAPAKCWSASSTRR